MSQQAWPVMDSTPCTVHILVGACKGLGPCTIPPACHQLTSYTSVTCSTLNDPAFKGTAFVPTNAAWSNLLTALGWSQDQLLDAGSRDALNETLQYTIVPGAAQTQRALAGLTYLAPLPTVQGQPLLVSGAGAHGRHRAMALLGPGCDIPAFHECSHTADLPVYAGLQEIWMRHYTALADMALVSV